ncbi:MAG TPA: IPT/TIG domain-containing protein, partial [Vicinamibacterales bacterium]|nr:IPT/TIG domain-containing protein [Vicinamibacterales bacterium]
MAGANGNSRIQFVVIRQEGAGNLWGPQFGEPQARMALLFFNAQGAEVGTFKFPHDAPGPQPATVLIATQEFADLPGAPAPDFIMPPLLNPVSGKVCFTNNPQGFLAFPRTDCLSYGNFTGNTGSSVGNGFAVAFGPPAAALPILNTVSLLRPNSENSVGSVTNQTFAITNTPTPKNGAGATFTIPVASQSAQGETLFTREGFGGNGRSCATCHVASQSFRLPPSDIQSRFSTVGSSFDPLFVGELKGSFGADPGFDFNLNTLTLAAPVPSNAPCTGDLRGIITTSNAARANVLARLSPTVYLVQGGVNPPLTGIVSDTHACSATVGSIVPGDLARTEGSGIAGLESPRRMRTSGDTVNFPQGRGLILENVDGIGPPLTPNVFRKSPHLLNLSRTAPFGFSGDVPNLRAFMTGAVIQHYPRTLARSSTGANPDFRLPDDDELQAIEAFMLAQEFPAGPDPDKFDLDRFATTEAQRRGRIAFFGGAKCSQCHGGTVLAATTVSIQGKPVGINATFNTGVVNQSINSALGDNLPPEAGGAREFSVPQLFNVKNLAPLFHDASAKDVAAAVEFYASGAFNLSPAGQAIGGISLSTSDKADLVAFLNSLAPRPYTLSQPRLSFNAQLLGTTSASQTITITNASAAAITFTGSGCALTGPNPADYTVTSCPLGTPLAAGESRSLQVAFKPTGGGPRAAILEVLGSDPSGIGLFGGGAPVPTAITPTSGPATGGTLVTIACGLSCNVAPGTAVAVAFGGVAATAVTIVNANTISAITPAHAAGTADVVLTAPDGLTGTLANSFTFVGAPTPTVTSVTPLVGPSSGGTDVTISGTNFAAGATVTFGGTAATAVAVVNATTITAKSPAHAAGPAVVTVKNADGQSVSGPNSFSYFDRPVPTSITPAFGLIQGGTTVTIAGSAFTAETTVTIGGAAASIVSVTPASITAVTGAHA